MFIQNDVTFVFNCYSDSKLDGLWIFVDNSIIPDNEKIINSENATKIHFYPSCLKGFVCTFQKVTGFQCEKNQHCYVKGDIF